MLGRFVPAAQHHNQHIALLDVIHTPAGTEEFAHLKHAFTDRGYVTEQTALRLVQPARKTPAGESILQPDKPVLELRQLLNNEHS